MHGATPLSNAVAAGSDAVIDALLSKDPELTLTDSFASFASRWVARLRGRADILAKIAR